MYNLSILNLERTRALDLVRNFKAKITEAHRVEKRLEWNRLLSAGNG